MTIPNPIEHCLIWGEGYRAKVSIIPGTLHSSVKSDRAGGAYRITDKARQLLEGKSEAWKARLTTWLINQREQGDREPWVTKEIVEYIDRQPPLPVHERAERLLRLLATETAAVAIGRNLCVPRDNSLVEHAWSESTEWGEVHFLLDYLRDRGWLKGGLTLVEYDGQFEGMVTVAGHSRIAEQITNINASQAFVAMWFDKRMDKAFDEGIEPAIKEAGYEAKRIDRKEHINKIDDEIIAEIRRSRFLVADFTQGCDGARGGVYFEAGFAHGLGIPVIYTCQEDVVDKLAFDTRQYNHILWKEPDDLRESLKNRIGAVMGNGLGKGQSN